jgi:acetoin utilization deacetylase AcuC-like enzyme
MPATSTPPVPTKRSDTDGLAISSLHDLDRHETHPRHPENPARLAAAWDGLQAAGIGAALSFVEPRLATTDELLRVHTKPYLDSLEEFCRNGGGDADPDTKASVGSWETACRAAGAGLALIESVERGDAKAGLALVRPPGHHALADRSMGFCLFNNVAIAAKSLTARGERVLIVDWDVHHGNGTQDIFWNDPNVLFVSSQLASHWPFSGLVSETGGAGAPGTTINLPFPAGTTGDVFLQAYDTVVANAVDQFTPTWVLISAGFDSHRADPLGGLGLSAGDYARMVQRLSAFVPGRVVVFLEGGYNLDATALSVGATAAAIVGATYEPERATSGGPGASVIAEAIDAHRRATS